MLINSISPRFYPYKPAFTAMRNNFYDHIYSSTGNNGSKPDEKILSTINHFFPKPKGIRIADIGAGDGRNSIPLAQLGYNVIALEPFLNGREKINESALKNRVSLEIEDTDILKVWPCSKVSPPVDGAIMSHVTMHFTDDELKTALKKLNSSIKPGGILIFDALINKGDEKPPTKGDVEKGYGYFDKKVVENAAKSSGFEIIEDSDYNELGNSRASFVNKRWWGGKGTLYYIDDFLFHKKRDVALKWFILKKKEEV